MIYLFTSYRFLSVVNITEWLVVYVNTPQSQLWQPRPY
jgi:hypothetical protein